MASCDTCRRPGHCCQNILISGRGWEDGQAWEDGWREEALRNLEPIGDHPFEPAMFIPWPEEYREKGVPPYGRVFWSCKNLTADGRCGDYKNRPLLCWEYVPGQDRMCIEHVHTFRGIPVVVA